MVAIKNFRMPKSCHDCNCNMDTIAISYDDPIGCLFTRKTYNWGLTKRPSDCPLVEIDDGLIEHMADDGR